jgi:hypothetical protein
VAGVFSHLLAQDQFELAAAGLGPGDNFDPRRPTHRSGCHPTGRRSITPMEPTEPKEQTGTETVKLDLSPLSKPLMALEEKTHMTIRVG